MLVKATYIAHSGYGLSIGTNFLLFDYFEGRIPEGDMENAAGRYIFASHSHGDHFNPSVMELAQKYPDTKLILSSDIGRGDVRLDRGGFYEDGNIRVSAFGSTDMGVSFGVEVNGRSLFHAGDLNFWHWRSESTPEEVADARARFEAELALIKEKADGFDCAFFPVDPRLRGRFWEGAEIFLQKFNVRHFFCMHMWEHYDAGVKFLHHYTGQTVIHTPRKRGQVFEIDI